jgi:hypothetical protein
MQRATESPLPDADPYRLCKDVAAAPQVPVTDCEFAERHDDPAQAEELERQQDA